MSFSDGQMREYGQQCRDAALEESKATHDFLNKRPLPEGLFLFIGHK